jgi:hypothetical protein
MVKQTWKGLKLAQKSTIGEIGIICACSDHGQSRYQIWIKCDKRQMLFMFVWPYVHPHILCAQLVICLLSHFIHIWYLDWPWSEHAHIIPISPMVDFCESYSPFHVCLTICPSAHLVYATSHLSFVAFYSYLVSWLAYTRCVDGRMVKQTWKGL